MDAFLERREVLVGAATLLGGAALSQPALAAEGPSHTVKTGPGLLRGTVQDGVAIFKGVHYGQSTAAAARFLPPRPVKPWSGIRDALNFGVPCPQPRYGALEAWLDPRDGEESEDCLVLNVWAPADARKLPVMVWIHGGIYMRGSGSLPTYDGANLAKQGEVVVVTINHRLNVFGYAYLGGFGQQGFQTSGNAGQLDIVESLRWVRDNIAGFGGDPSNITLFGESGGGGKINALLGMPQAKGLFHKAVIESGSLLRFAEPDDAHAAAQPIFTRLGLKEGDIEALQQVPAETLLQCYVDLRRAPPKAPTDPMQFGPVVDGYALPRQPWASSAPEISADVPLMIGTNSDEGAMALGRYSAFADDAALAARIGPIANPVELGLPNPDPQKAIDFYRSQTPEMTRPEILVRVNTDAGLWRASIQQCEMKARQARAPAFHYEFTWDTPCFGGAYSLHSVEIPFVFNNMDYGTAWDGKDTPEQRAAADPSGERFRLARDMVKIWSTFARTGDPSTADVGRWKPYDLSERQTMVLGKEYNAVNDIRGAARRFLDEPDSYLPSRT